MFTKKHASGYSAKVAATLGTMGINPNVKAEKERALREENTKVNPKVAKVLAEAGVVYDDKDIAHDINEQGTSPLDMPGEAPMVDPNTGQRNGMQGQNNPQDPTMGQNKPQKALGPAEIKLKRPATQMQTLQDLTDKMTEVTANIKTVDLLVQALSDNKSTDNQIKTHRLTLRGPIQAILNSVEDLKKMVG
jgi:hypothetical protein